MDCNMISLSANLLNVFCNIAIPNIFEFLSVRKFTDNKI
jgi:hypothetical protein